MTTGNGSRPSTARTRASGRRTKVLLAVIALQAVVPVIALLGDPPTRFGFQMFGGYEVGNEVTVRDSAGGELPFEERDLWHVPLSPELDWARRLPAHLCGEVAGAAEVVVFQHATGEQVVPCP